MTDLQKAIDAIVVEKINTVGALKKELEKFDDDMDLSIDCRLGEVCEVTQLWGIDGFCVIETGNRKERGDSCEGPRRCEAKVYDEKSEECKQCIIEHSSYEYK